MIQKSKKTKSAFQEIIAMKVNEALASTVNEGYFAMKNAINNAIDEVYNNDMSQNILEKLSVELERKKIESPDEFDALLAKIVIEVTNEMRILSEKMRKATKQVVYVSIEFLIGRVFYSNLSALGIISDVKSLIKKHGYDNYFLEEINELSIGNGGLGRLAACFLESIASLSLPGVGSTLLYTKGLFRQDFTESGQQIEKPDNWAENGMPWCVPTGKKYQVKLSGRTVIATEYEIPIYGQGGFYSTSIYAYQVDGLTDLLYPKDSTNEGKKTRIEQEILLATLTMKRISNELKEKGIPFEKIDEHYVLQLNDTHPSFIIPILFDELRKSGCSTEKSIRTLKKMLNYTNHTILPEALECWQGYLVKEVSIDVYNILTELNRIYVENLHSLGYSWDQIRATQAIIDDQINMARFLVNFSANVNGVAKIHSDIVANNLFSQWKDKDTNFTNVTNGVSFVRWLDCINPELVKFITTCLGSDEWLRNTEMLEELKNFVNDKEIIGEFASIKALKKKELNEYILHREGTKLLDDALNFVQVKRIHEYKRQLLTLLGVIAYYQKLKQDKSFRDTCPKVNVILGGKAAAEYRRAKAIILIAKRLESVINNDPDVNQILRLCFVTNYDVTYAEKIIPGCDYSLQVSTAGKEASGTSNMKFMLNGAVTFGTLDGANVEILEYVGEESFELFGADVKSLDMMRNSGFYDPWKIYTSIPWVKNAVDFLIDKEIWKTQEEREIVGEIYRSLIHDQPSDQYFVLLDLISHDEKAKLHWVGNDQEVNGINNGFEETLLRILEKSKDEEKLAQMQFLNTASAGYFSSDRSIREYASKIWKITPVKSN